MLQLDRLGSRRTQFEPIGPNLIQGEPNRANWNTSLLSKIKLKHRRRSCIVFSDERSTNGMQSTNPFFQLPFTSWIGGRRSHMWNALAVNENYLCLSLRHGKTSDGGRGGRHNCARPNRCVANHAGSIPSWKAQLWSSPRDCLGPSLIAS